MPLQTSYNFISLGFAGERVGLRADAATYVNDAGAVPQVDNLAVAAIPAVAQVENVSTTAAGHADGTYVVTINGVASTFTASTSSLAAIVSGLVTAINASGQPVTASDHANAHTSVDITANVAGVPFTIAVSGSGTAQVVGHTTASFGDGSTMSFTVNGVLVAFAITHTTTQAQARDGLIAALRGIQSLENVVFANPSGTNVQLTAAVPGTAFTTAALTTSLTLTHTTANVAPVYIPFGVAITKRTGAGTVDKSAGAPTGASQSFLGVAERIHTIVDPLQGANASLIAPGMDMTVGYRGRWYVQVEVAVSPEDAAYFRTAANGALTTLGAWRNDSDSGNADLATASRFKTSAVAGGIAELEINLP